MNDNVKKYNLYNSIDVDKEDTSEYPKDSYISPNQTQNVGKLDSYSKEKELYNKQKSKIVLKTSNIADDQERKLDDLIPSNIGGAIDNVFSKVDNLLNATGKLLFGGVKKAPVKSKPPIVRPVQPVVQQPVSQKPQVQAQPKEPPQVIHATQQVNAVKTTPAPVKKVVEDSSAGSLAAKLAAKKTKVSTKKQVVYDEDYEEGDNSPLITRTTYISEIDLPLELLNDPDLVRYFDQMKLYDKKVTGGLCSKTYNQTAKALRRGRWGKMFTVMYNQIKVNSLMSSAEAGLNRFNGMLPVYKALAKNFPDPETLRKAIENDINSYLKTGEGSADFHKFTYKTNKK